MGASGSVTMDAPDMGYFNLLHDDTLAEILSRLMEPIDIVHSALACKPWFHVITVHGILRRYRPPVLCGVFRERMQGLYFSPTDQIASPDLAAKTSNVPTALAQYLPGRSWSITDSLEGLLLLNRPLKGHFMSWTCRSVLAIFNTVSGDLQELPPTPKIGSSSLISAAILRDDTGGGRCALPGGAPDLLFKVACVVAIPGTTGNGRGQWTFSTLVHSASPGDQWDEFPSRVVVDDWKFDRHPTRVGDALFNYPFHYSRIGADGMVAGWAHRVDATTVMLNIRTCTVSSVALPPVSRLLPEGCTFVDYGGRGRDHKLWFVCIHDLLVLRLYSQPKPSPPEEEETSTTGLGGNEQWTLERDVQLLEGIEDLANADGELHARNVHSQNGYVFFAVDDYGYFSVHLRSMRVQRLSGVQGAYMGHLYPFLCHHDL